MLFSSVFSQTGPPARLIEAAVIGQFVPVVSSFVLGEFVRNIAAKAPQLLAPSGGLLRETPLEVIREADAVSIRVWRDAGFSTDAPVIAAALAATVDYLCTGDRGIHEKGALIASEGLLVITPRDLLTLLEARPDLEL